MVDVSEQYNLISKLSKLVRTIKNNPAIWESKLLINPEMDPFIIYNYWFKESKELLEEFYILKRTFLQLVKLQFISPSNIVSQLGGYCL